MATKLDKAVFRVSYTVVRDRSKRRELVVGLETGDIITFRMKGTRQSVSVPIHDVYWYAMKKLAAHKLREKAAERRAKRESNKMAAIYKAEGF